MKRADALRIIAANRERFSEFHVKSLWLFGSVARDEASETSDVDVLVEFEEDWPVGLFLLIRLKHCLEDILGCGVDLGTPDSLREQIRDQVLKEAIHAA